LICLRGTPPNDLLIDQPEVILCVDHVSAALGSLSPSKTLDYSPIIPFPFLDAIAITFLVPSELPIVVE
jgi:hypothetical protein